MQPQDRQQTPLIPDRSHQPVTRDANSQNLAAANIARDQIDAIFEEPIESRDTVSPTQDIATNTDTHSHQTTHTTTSSDQEHSYRQEQPHSHAQQWQHYHSAWQNYYQQYYERYYVGAVQQAQSQMTPPRDDTMSEQEAMNDLRSKIRHTIKKKAKTVQKSRHFMPAIAAISVVIVFMFLQYNRMVFANVQAFISPGNINPANIIVDTDSGVVGPEPKLIIPKINVEVPIDFNATSDHDSQMDAMEKGVAYFGIPGANSKPGQAGNIPIAGHSSNDVFDNGSFKFIFARLSQLDVGDTFMINYNSKRYVYNVTRKEVVKPSQVDKLQVGNKKPMATLITCTPIGTALNRLLVFAEQVSPAPDSAAKPTTNTISAAPPKLTGNSPTFLQRIFGGGGAN